MKQRVWCSVLIGLVFLGMLPPSPACAAVIFGPERIEVASGKPVTVNRQFSASAGERAILTLSGAEGREAKQVASGSVLLNGVKIVAPAAFNQQVGGVVREVELAQENQLTFSFSGPPGSFVVISIATLGAPPEKGPMISFDPLLDGPLDGATITAESLTLSGMVMGGDLAEIGVVVNGVPAQVSGNRFIANHVALVAGTNSISAVVTDAVGQSSTATAQVTAVPTEAGVEIDALAPAGLAPFTLELIADTIIAGGGTSQQISCIGPAPVTLAPLDEERFTGVLTLPGLYLCTLEARDASGTVFRDQVGVNVYAGAELDALLQSRWQGMRTALAAADVEGAVRQFSAMSQEKYRITFIRLLAQLPELAGEMRAPELVSVLDNHAEYRVTRDQVFNGRNLPISYDVNFVKDGDGRWKIESF